MRLPWPFGRGQRSAPADGEASSGGLTASRAEAASGAAWRELPPLAETVGPPPLVAPVRPFAASLAASEPPPPILAPLSHGRSLEGPKGLVSGIARPAVARPAAALPPPIQRSPLGGSRRASNGEPAAEWFDPSPAPEPDRAPVAAAAGAAPSPAAPPRPDGAKATPLSRRAMTRAPQPTRPPLVGVVGQPRASGAAHAPLAMPSPAAVQRAPIASSAATAPSAPPPDAPGADLVTSPPRLTLGQARRLGLGAPIAGGLLGTNAGAFTGLGSAPGSPASARPPAASPADARPDPGRSPADAPDLPLVSRPASAHAEAASGPGPATPSPAAAPGPGPGPSASAIAPRPVVASRPATAPRSRAADAPSSPIVSARPLRAGIQRAPLAGPSRAGEPAAAPGAAAASGHSSAAPVKVHRGSEASNLATALDARSFTHGAEIYLPSSHGPLSSGKGRSLLAHEMTHVVQQRRLGSSLPAEDSAHGRKLEAEAVAAERAPDMTLAAASGHTTSQPTGANGPSSSSAPDGAVPDAAGPGPQRAPDSSRQAPRREQSGRTSGGGKGSHVHTEQELEVLAHQLYHRIGRHLRRELLVDRERAGFALDLR